MTKVLVVVGSLRRNSINKKLSLALGKLAAPELEFTWAQLDELPVYNEDLWEAPPAAATKLKEDFAAAQGILIVTPEHNRSITTVTQNVVDWASRPRGKNSWAGKPVALIGTTPGTVGTAVAQHHLRGMLGIIDARVMGTPEGYIVYKEGLIDEQHNITVDSTRAFLQTYLDRFADFIAWASR